MKPAVNKTGSMRFVKVGRQRAQARHQIVDRRRPEFAKRLVE